MLTVQHQDLVNDNECVLTIHCYYFANNFCYRFNCDIVDVDIICPYVFLCNKFEMIFKKTCGYIPVRLKAKL